MKIFCARGDGFEDPWRHLSENRENPRNHESPALQFRRNVSPLNLLSHPTQLVNEVPPFVGDQFLSYNQKKYFVSEYKRQIDRVIDLYNDRKHMITKFLPNELHKTDL